MYPVIKKAIFICTIIIFLYVILYCAGFGYLSLYHNKALTFFCWKCLGLYFIAGSLVAISFIVTIVGASFGMIVLMIMIILPISLLYACIDAFISHCLPCCSRYEEDYEEVFICEQGRPVFTESGLLYTQDVDGIDWKTVYQANAVKN